jgi:hypothetical protein
VPQIETERPRANVRRDLADPTHARRSLRASFERRVAAVRARRRSRAGRSLVVMLVASLALGTAGAVAMSTSDVRQVQRELGVSADGVVGPQTRAAVKRFQRRNGLVPDGVIGPATLGALGLEGLSDTPRTQDEDDDRGSGTAPTARLRRIAQCESGGDPTAVSPDGRYRGKYQFSRATWRSLGGEGDPAEASEAEQDRMAAKLMATQGPGAWPSCA